MTPAAFRRLVLELPGATEGSHMGHADFRADGKVFAGLSPDEDFATIKLTLDDQERLVDELPTVFVPMNGAWGRAGWTRVTLSAARVGVLRPAIAAARAALIQDQRTKAKDSRGKPSSPAATRVGKDARA